MSLWTNITNRFKRAEPTSVTTATPAPTPNTGASATDVYAKLKADQDRLSVIKTCRLMYDTDSRVKKALRTYARDLVRAGFFIRTENEQAAQIISDMQKRLKLNRKLQDMVKLSGRDGDSFYELVVDENYDIVEFSRKPTLRMRRNSNERDTFDDSTKAFYMVPNDMPYDTQVPKNALWFAEWQMIHVRNDHDEERRYGTPMWASSTGAFKKTTEGEMDIAVRRKVRAGMRYQHIVEGSATDIEAYKELNKIALNNPTAASIDFFSNKAGSLNAVQGDARLNEIDDILHHISTMFFASETPMELLGYGGDLNRDVLGEKKAEYDETLDDGREWITEDLIVPLVERQWLLKGILPASVDYKVMWRKAKGITPLMIRDLADAMMRLRVLGVKEDMIQILMAQFLPDVDLEIMNGEGLDSEKFATMLKGLSI
jgi:hypothetical protein